MKAQEFSYISDDGKSIHVRRWTPSGKPLALILAAHGMAEHGGRYAAFAEAMTGRGYEVWAPDHRGHGKTAAEGELGWLAEKDGFRRVVDDLHGLAERMRSDVPGVPLFLLGHSWGSMLSQGFVGLYGKLLSGCILSSTTADGGPVAAVGKLIVALGGRMRGWKTPSPLADTMSFGAYNKPFKPTRTKFDWLSRDNAEVDAYVADPFCGFVCTWGYFRDILSGMSWMSSRDVRNGIPKDLPILLASGTDDPLGGTSGGLQRLIDAYKAQGLTSVDVSLYKGGRHELLHETNRAEVTGDIGDWIARHLPAR
ncbi:MAG: lysophospholipase [Spirochaetales bacterium]|nr:lysophospholipase [Spirochaetales bacterium]